MKPPYYAAFFQGEDFVINVKVDAMKIFPGAGNGFITLVWIKYRDYEWLINLEDQTVKYKNGSEKFTKERTHKLKGESAKYYGKDNFICTINLPLAEIISRSNHRQLRAAFTSEFYKKYGDLKKCYGALISKKHLRYLSRLKEIIS